MKLLLQLSDIPKNSVVALYGAGQAGENVLKILRTFRPDVTPRHFIDSFKTGELAGLPIVTFDAFLHNENPQILVLIASVKWREIEVLFMERNFKNYFVIPPHFFVPSAYGGLLNSKADDPCQDTMSYELFSPDDRIVLKDQLAFAQQLLAQPEDRRLFRLLTGEDAPYPSYAENISHYYYTSTLKPQYFDFIDYQNIGTIIEGGVADGGDTLQFLKQPGKPKIIHGFEPNSQDYLESPNKSKLETNPNVKINFTGLWNHSGKLYFNVCGLSSGIISEVLPGMDSHNLRAIDVISIDEYVKKENIAKVDFIKLDVEGAELEVLKGAIHTLKTHRPHLAICIYHKKEHFFQIPFFLKEQLSNYQYRLGHYTPRSFESVWYGIPGKESRKKSRK